MDRPRLEFSGRRQVRGSGIATAATIVVVVCLASGVRSDPSSPPSLPNIQFHLTARPWTALDTPRDVYLDRIEGIVRFEATLQNAGGAIIDPVAKTEWQYATPYFANALGLLLTTGRTMDLLDKGVAAMNSATSQMAIGNSAIPEQHGNFFIAPMADALTLYAPFVPTSQITTWKNRMMLPIASLIQNFTHNWRGYAMKGQWYRFQQGLVSNTDAINFIEDGWTQTQRTRFTGDAFNLYHDGSSDPDTFAYDAASRANLWHMLVRGYNGPSAAEMSRFIQRGTQSALLLQDATGQAPVGGRSGLHSWNDVYSGLGFEVMAERAHADGNERLAGQFRRAAMLALRSVDRWRSAAGFFFVTKNKFDINLRVRYADYSQLTNYNGNVMFHMAESWRARQSAVTEQPAPVEIGGYAMEPDPQFAVAVANAGGMQIEAALRGTTGAEFGQFWTTLGIARFSRVDWDSRLGPSDGVRETASSLGVSYAPTFLEGGNWIRLASVPQRYAATFAITFTHPLLVRCRIDYAPRAGQTGPTFSDDLVITPDGVLSTITSSAAAGNFGVTWPLLTSDGGGALTTTFLPRMATVNFPAGGDQQSFIALNPTPTFVTNLPTLRSSYGDVRPVRMLSGAADVQTFIYPRSPWDPSADSVRGTFARTATGFSSVLGRVAGNIYLGRTSAGGVGTAIDLNNDGQNDVTFSASCGFVLQLANGRVTAIEADRAVTATVQGKSVTLAAFAPITLAPSSTSSFEAESGTLAGGTQNQACPSCSAGRRIGFVGNSGTGNGTLTFGSLNVPVDGTYTLTMFYSNGDAATRTATLTVNGVDGPPVSFPTTGDFAVTAPVATTVALKAGANSITIGNATARAPSFDRFTLALAFEAEAATLAGGAAALTCAGCSGGQRVGSLGNTGTGTATASGTATFTNITVPTAGNYALTLLYINQDIVARTATLTVNGVAGAPITFPSTGSLTTVAPITATVALNAGPNTIAIGNTAARAPSLDRIILNVP